MFAALKGLLSRALRKRVNYVNAAIEAQERGIRVIETKDSSTRDYSGGSLHVEAQGANGKHSVTGRITE